MAHNLNLNINPDGKGGVKISWTDITKRPELSILAQIVFGIAVLGGFLAMLVLLLSTGNFIFLLGWMAASIGFPIYMRMHIEKSNSITFGREVTTHNHQTFPTSSISRIEYGLETQLTGAKRNTAFQGHNEEPQNLIRLWLNDSAAHEISLNNWQTQVNHEIRDALAKALDAVRKVEAEEKHEKTHGKSGDFGMPDY